MTNLVMVAVMVIARVHLVAHGHSHQHVGFVVSLHVAGMFTPSPLSGWAADRFRAPPAPPARRRLEPWAGGGSVLLATSVPAALEPRVEGVGEILLVALGGFRALSLVGAAAALAFAAFHRNGSASGAPDDVAR